MRECSIWREASSSEKKKKTSVEMGWPYPVKPAPVQGLKMLFSAAGV